MKLWSAVSTAVFSIALIAAMLPTAASAVSTSPPSEATIGIVTPGNGSLAVAFTAPTTGAPITGYTLTATPSGISTALSGSATSGVLQGLTNGVTYTLVLKATNAYGSSAGTGSATTTARPGAVPAAPTGVTATATGATGAIAVAWTPPPTLGGGTFVSYVATASNGVSCTPITSATTTTCNITGLSNGTPYTASVKTTTSIGSSASSASSLSATPFVKTVPGTMAAPTAVATGATGAVKVTWVAPATGGSAIDLFTVTSTPDTKTCTAASGTFCTVTGLTNETPYTFIVTARNVDTGTSASVNASTSATPYIKVGPPTGVTISAANGTSATVTWVDDTTGSGTSTYKVSLTPNITGFPVAAITATTQTLALSDLSEGQPYTVVVQTVGASGGTANVASASGVTFKPSGSVPSAPQNLLLGRDVNGTDVTVTFATPVVIGAGSLIYALAVTNADTAASVTPTIAGGSTAASFVSGHKVTGLDAGTNYTISVTAKSPTGPGGIASDTIKVGAAVPAPELYTSNDAAGGAADPIIYTDTATSMLANILASGNVLVHDWPASTGTGGTATGYVVTAYTTATPPVAASSCSPTNLIVLSCEIPGLAPGVTYNLAIAGSDANGTGPETGQIVDTAGTAAAGSPLVGGADGTLKNFSVTMTQTTPGAPTGVTAVAGDGQAKVAFTAPASTGAPAGTTLTYSVTATDVATSGAIAPVGSYVSGVTAYTGLINGHSYTFKVTVSNDTATSLASAASGAVTPFGAPAAPTGASAVPGNGMATVSWTAPAVTNGSAITGYTVTASPGASTCSTTGVTTCDVSGLVNGNAYTFTVVAKNGAATASGASAPSTAVTPAGVASAPLNVVAVAGNAQATVSFTLPLSNGDSPITSYKATASTGGASCTTSGVFGQTCLVTGLANGTFYSFSVVATNLLGDSPAGTTASVQPRVGAALDTTVNHAFTDVGTVGTEAANAIAALYNTTPAITQGMTTSTYGPLVPVNRANMAVFLSRSIQAVGHTVNTAVNHTFADVAGLTAEQQSSIAAIGNTTPAVTTGVTATSYEPASTVSRGEMAAFLSRTWESLGGTCDSAVNHAFTDVGSSFFQAEIACVWNLGVAQGTTLTTFAPAAPVNRLQMAVFLFRLVDLAVAQGL